MVSVAALTTSLQEEAGFLTGVCLRIPHSLPYFCPKPNYYSVTQEANWDPGVANEFSKPVKGAMLCLKVGVFDLAVETSK